ncbi:AGE family epimerase/isomerase [Marinovum sp.]|uniref:AGE family epimerase/isomerase n=1 Tax=Marinovum sp. TaxID=2024839 RepID=UPI002B2744D8|nr:AGE family epimerase/isomerase [Marinovum sp.]
MTQIAPHFPDVDASAEAWVDWFWAEFLPAWAVHATDAEGIGFYDVLDAEARPVDLSRRTLLAQARLLFTFSHLALLSDRPEWQAAAAKARAALPAFRKAPGLYCRATLRDGTPAARPEDRLTTSYDQSFVILGLATWGRLHPEEDVSDEIEACWQALETRLTDPATGLLLEHDGLADPAAPEAPPRAQNPHMHNYEAALQAFEMTGNAVWLTRAQAMRGKGLAYFLDVESGTISEFLAPDLSVQPGRDGQRREIGHQCEWAWLLLREVELGGDPDMANVAARLLAFADAHGFAESGVMQGAAFDAVSADAAWREDRFLLWPQTEAIKGFAVRATDPAQAQRARDLARLIFRRYFAGRPGFANQLDAEGRTTWPEGLSRLHYHLVLALTEGARAGLWRGPV